MVSLTVLLQALEIAFIVMIAVRGIMGFMMLIDDIISRLIEAIHSLTLGFATALLLLLYVPELEIWKVGVVTFVAVLSISLIKLFILWRAYKNNSG